MNQPTKGTAVRLPLDLHTLISDAAVENNRSRHAEMLHRLASSFEELPCLDTDVVVEILSNAAVDAMTKVFTTCFTQLEERVAAMLDKQFKAVELSYVTELKVDASEADIEALRVGLKAEGAYDQLSKLWEGVEYRKFDFPGRPATASPTGRLSDTDPELQDLPAVSGFSSLVAAFKARGCMCGGGLTGEEDLKAFQERVLGKPFHTGGFTGLPAGELPQILARGERVATTDSITFGRYSSGPLTGQTWVITGSLESMTRDRAREIIMELGGTVAGAVDGKTHALLWGPGAGSKKTRAEQLGVQQYTERQFVELIRSHGVDMPVPKDEPAPDAVWLENTHVRPVAKDRVVEVRVRDGQTMIGRAGEFAWHPTVGDGVITHWRLAE